MLFSGSFYGPFLKESLMRCFVLGVRSDVRSRANQTIKNTQMHAIMLSYIGVCFCYVRKQCIRASRVKEVKISPRSSSGMEKNRIFLGDFFISN